MFCKITKVFVHGFSYVVLGWLLFFTSFAAMAVEIAGNAGDGIRKLAAGDFNGDGRQDFVVAVSHYDSPAVAGCIAEDLGDLADPTDDIAGSDPADPECDGKPNSGAVFGFLSSLGGPAIAGSVDLSSASFVMSGAVEYDYAGTSLSSIGDINGDGYDDFAVGSYQGLDINAGSVYIVFGKASLMSYTTLADSNILRLTGEAASDRAGWSVSGAGDVNGDGYDDIVIGAYANDAGGSNAGAAYIMHGEASLSGGTLSLSNPGIVRFTGEVAVDYAGWSASGAGDVNGDGYDDVVIGAYANDGTVGTDAGAAYIVYGSVSLSSGSLGDPGISRFTGEAASDYAGYSVSSAGDVNGDGYDDVVIGAYANDGTTGTDAGAAYIVYGSASLSSGSLGDPGISRFTGEAASDYAGRSVSNAGDINGDGYADVLIGAEQHSSVYTSSGAAYVVLGRAGMIMSQPIAPSFRIRKFIGKSSNDSLGDNVGYVGESGGISRFYLAASNNDDNGSGAGKIWIFDRLPAVLTGFELVVP